MVHILNTRGWFKWSVMTLVVLNLVACGNLFLDDQKLVQKARDYLEKREINAAAIELRNALQKNPDNAEARYLLGSINLDFGDFATAEKEFRRAIEAGFEEEPVFIDLARAQMGQRHYTQLIDDIEVRESFSATSRANLLGLLAAAEAGAGNSDRAWVVLAEGASLDPESVELMKATAQLQLLAGKQGEAKDTLAHALKSHPGRADLLLMSADLAAKAGDSIEAKESYQQVIVADPSGFISYDGSKARIGLAKLQIMAGELEQAESTLKPLFKRAPGNPQTNLLGGVLAMQQRNYDLAEERLLKVLKVAPDHAESQLLFGSVNYAKQNYEQAAYFVSKYLVTVPDNMAARKLLARSYLMLNQNDLALETLQSEDLENTDDAELLALVSLSELKKGETVTGIARLEQAVAVEPDNTVLRSELAKAYLAKGEAGLAVRQLEEILAKGGEQKQAETLLVLAHLRAGEFEQAINRMLEMLSKNPQDPAYLSFAGIVFAASGDKQEARKYFVRALQVDPDFPQAMLSLARLEEMDGNIDEAVALYRKLVDRDIKPEVSMMALARLAEKQGENQEIVKWLNMAIENAPDEIRPRVILAMHYLSQDQPEKARPLVVEAARLSPQKPEVLELQGRLFMAEQRYQEALAPLTSLVDSKPGYVNARLLLSECQTQLGQLKEARKQLDSVLQQQDEHMGTLALLARLEIKEGKLDQALEYSQRIQQEYPETYLGFQLEGDIRTIKGQYEAAERAYEQAWVRNDSTELAIRRARNHIQAGDLNAAAAILESRLNGHPDDVTARLSLAVTYEKLGLADKVVQAYENVLEADPENAVALNNLAWRYMQSNNPEAVMLAERAYQASPDSPGIVDTYGWILVQRGQADKALPLLEKAKDQLSNVPEVHYHYAVALYKTGAKEEAWRLLEELLKDGKPFEGQEDARRILGEKS